MKSAFDFMSPSKLGSPNKRSSKRRSSKKSPPKKSSSKSAKRSPPKSAKTLRRTSRSTARSTSRKSSTPKRSYRRRTGAKKHGTMRSYLKGKDMKTKLKTITESPSLTPESKRLRRLGFYRTDGRLPRTPRMNRSAREKIWDDVAGERRY